MIWTWLTQRSGRPRAQVVPAVVVLSAQAATGAARGAQAQSTPATVVFGAGTALGSTGVVLPRAELGDRLDSRAGASEVGSGLTGDGGTSGADCVGGTTADIGDGKTEVDDG